MPTKGSHYEGSLFNFLRMHCMAHKGHILRKCLGDFERNKKTVESLEKNRVLRVKVEKERGEMNKVDTLNCRNAMLQNSYYY